MGFIAAAARSFAVVRPKLNWLRGKQAWYSGKRKRAWQYWQTSSDLAVALDMPYDELLVACARSQLRSDAAAGARAAALQERMQTGQPLEVAHLHPADLHAVDLPPAP